ncbi:MAG TPA: hypothetical protein VM029_02285, partial [Opitutaceae bacterium]|nr:hypothetical protein [Opitutaceae bacterium]
MVLTRIQRLSGLLTLCALAWPGRGETILEATVNQVPADATEVVFILDVATALEGPGYEDLNAAPPVAIPAAAAT